MFLFAGVAVIGAGIFLQRNFQREVPVEQFTVSQAAIPPTFYCYAFTDRTNREGEDHVVSFGVPQAKKETFVTWEEIPDRMKNAFIAIEDRRFWEHHGVDWFRTAAAGANYLLGFSDTFGASTITQQLVKNVTGDNEVTPRRKLQEIFYARDLERLMDKSEILTLYLNVIPFSDGCVGIRGAANHYFSKEVGELTAAECASIAAITNNPTRYHPVKHPENNLARRNLILFEMARQGYLNEEEYREAVAEPLSLCVESGRQGEEIHSWYIDMVVEDVISDLSAQTGISRAAASYRVYTGGLHIWTAMDEEIQKTVENEYAHAVRMPQNANGISAQSALILIDNRTGDILGVAGAVGEKTANRVQNYATQAKRPPGSSIKPISVYAPALEMGKITWSSVYDDVPVNFGATGTQPWPRNATGYYRGLTNIAYAVAHSTNTVAVRVLEEIGVDQSFRYAKEKFHLESLVDGHGVTDRDVAALALGQLNYGVTLRELTAAYTVFADAGVYHPWRSYYRVTDEEGNLLLSSPDRSEIVLSGENAAIMTKLLQGVVLGGTSSAITLTRMTECAGKTGTTQNDGDRWFIGYTPEVICGVWCGYDYPEPLTERNLCTGIWNSVMTRIVEEKGGKTVFEVPSGVVRRSYCRDSGALPDDACQFDPRGNRTEIGWFAAGSEPTELCRCHILCETDGESGGICHGFCPEEVRKKTALIRVNRHFPIPVQVTDAQYVYGGEPLGMLPNPDGKQAYFEPSWSDYCGRSPTESPFNRSCTAHGEILPPPKDDAYETEPKDSENSRNKNPFARIFW